MRRSRLALGGVFLKDWQYRVEYEFATGASALTDAYVAYKATAALSWYLNPFLRVSANYVRVVEVQGGALDGEKPSIWQMRLQLAI